jgi:hypothetical protein
VHRNEEVENTTITDDAVQLLQVNVGNKDNIIKSHSSGNILEITEPSETTDSGVNSANHVQHISSKKKF